MIPCVGLYLNSASVDGYLNNVARFSTCIAGPHCSGKTFAIEIVEKAVKAFETYLGLKEHSSEQHRAPTIESMVRNGHKMGNSICK